MEKKPKRKLITQKAYAARRGVSPPAINKWVKKGVIRLFQGKVDPEQADRAIREYADPAREIGASAESPRRLTYAQARTELEQYKAGLARLDFEERSGKLHDTGACQQEAFAEGRKFRDAMLNIPDRISAILAAEMDETRVNSALKQEIRAALDEYVSG